MDQAHRPSAPGAQRRGDLRTRRSTAARRRGSTAARRLEDSEEHSGAATFIVVYQSSSGFVSPFCCLLPFFYFVMDEFSDILPPMSREDMDGSSDILPPMPLKDRNKEVKEAFEGAGFARISRFQFTRTGADATRYPKASDRQLALHDMIVFILIGELEITVHKGDESLFFGVLPSGSIVCHEVLTGYELRFAHPDPNCHSDRPVSKWVLENEEFSEHLSTVLTSDLLSLPCFAVKTSGCVTTDKAGVLMVAAVYGSVPQRKWPLFVFPSSPS